MAKTIKEMAHQYVYEHCDKDKNAITMQCAYEAGANDVLEIFESILPFVAKKGIIYVKIKETIEQLKK